MDTPDPEGGPLALPGADLRFWPGFLAAGEAEEVLAVLLEQLDWRQQVIAMFGRTIPEPRLVAWYGDPGAVYRYSGRSNQPLAWTPELASLRDRAAAATGRPFNSALANLYRSGADHMGWHADDERELGPAPAIASLSLGAVRRMQFRPRPSGPVALDLALPSGSLLLMAGQTQRLYHHRIAKSPRPTGRRINLTFRWVGPGGGLGLAHD